MLQQAWHWQARVYYEDTDAGGIVFYANYLRYFERARTEWLRHLGFEHAAMRDQHGVLFVVKSLQVDYDKPARLDDQLLLSVKLKALKRASLVLEQTALLQNSPQDEPVLLVSAEVRLACVGISASRPVALPAQLYNGLYKTLQHA